MSTIAPTTPTLKGGEFLIRSVDAREIFTPEDFTEEHRAIARTTDEFWNKEVVPNLEAIQHQDHEAAARVLKKSAELGLTAVVVPESYGGMEMDLISAMIVAEGLARDGSYAGWHGAHAGIGTLPLLLFGTEDQKQKYLPKLTSGEWIGAYALTEPHAGSDALAAKTRADLSEDGSHYVLNGSKMWITNAGKADLFTVFAKVNGEQFTAFLVERNVAGLTVGQEEKKMGIKGSSTCAVYFDNVRVPASNLLGETGRGHIIAFNILNLGRLKLGPFAVGGSKNVIQSCIKYAKERNAFGGPIARFGVIQYKLAEMMIRTFAAETMSYRVAGEVERHGDVLKGAEEFAIECSYVKVFASEVLDYVVDEGVQIHGGYGYHQDYMVERAYRDSRINRIFEGTNEINRLLATGMLLKRAMRGQLPLVAAVKQVQDELLSPSLSAGAPDLVANARKITLIALGVAFQRFREKLDEQQEVVAALTDCAMNTFAMESVALRCERLQSTPKAAFAADVRDVFLRDALNTVEDSARMVLSAASEGDALRTNMAVLRRFAKYDPVDSVTARRRLATRMLETGRYLF
ncbi:acyl-CoA dehydrogenase family protein [Paludibaculum fermentans]|uniref:Acyl-CoA dehydrogenase family protein n=1 Tax=Paludibaculum fermentans TaxID=1473598 RepID=A0A7S7NP90_PALFE|nr:acyl-CoA dehydrogenase family protein [Paludibaculum fermentans]QOY87271.1 acyl-CoA dehydrogenase family protein [Paludibaculum fermentans]